MHIQSKRMKSAMKRFLKMITQRTMVLALIIGLVFSQASPAFAARSGGRAGGFRAPSPSRSLPSSGGSYGGGYRGGGGYYGGGGFGFPFMLPFMFGGGGGLFSLLIFFAIASFLVNTFRNLSAGGNDGTGAGLSSTANPTVTVAKVQIGLLASARELQTDLNRVARTSDTSTNEGLAGLLQESVLALLRHPEFWAYGNTESEVTKLTQAETAFNRYTLQARSKLAAETLSNVNGQLRNDDAKAIAAGETLAEVQGENEYIVATLIIASKGKLSIPQINNASDLRQALRTAGSISSEELYGVELLWEPQAEGDVLTADEVMADYPNLRLVA
jgi:uncharacterized membrane protein